MQKIYEALVQDAESASNRTKISNPGKPSDLPGVGGRGKDDHCGGSCVLVRRLLCAGKGCNNCTGYLDEIVLLASSHASYLGVIGQT